MGPVVGRQREAEGLASRPAGRAGMAGHSFHALAHLPHN